MTVKEKDYLINIDFRLVKPAEYATTLHHFTGSKDHNIAMRQRAKKRGEKINEYSEEIEKSGEVVQFETEEAFFNHVDLQFIPHEVHQDGREIERFESKVQLLEHN